MAILCCVAKNSLRGTPPVNSSVLFRLLFRFFSRWVEAVLMLNMEASSCIHHQLGCSFWHAGHCHNGQGHPIHLFNVVLYMQAHCWVSSTCTPLTTTLRATGWWSLCRQIKNALHASGAGPAWHSHRVHIYRSTGRRSMF
jgi:hypothetical protein